jgi:hypothetical protein
LVVSSSYKNATNDRTNNEMLASHHGKVRDQDDGQVRCLQRKNGCLTRRNKGWSKRDDGLPRSDGGRSREMKSVVEHQEDPTKEATVESIGALED